MRTYFSILLICAITLSFSQNPYYTTIDNTSGLPSNSVYDIFQDSNGFMWFATGKGLCKYDGNFVKTFTADFQSSKSGSCIQEDKFGRIWYENFDGFLYYVKNDELKSLRQDKPIGYFRFGIINNFLLLVTTNGVVFYDLKTLQPTKKINLQLAGLSFVYCTKDKLYVFDDKLHEIDVNGCVKSFGLPVNFKTEFNSPIVQQTNNGIVIISKYTNNYCIFENQIFVKHKFSFPTEFIQNLATQNKNMWLCTTKGIIFVNAKTNQSKTYFANKNISYVYQDKDQNYWVSTINEGVYFIENFDTKIIELPAKPIAVSQSKLDVVVGLENDAVFKIEPTTHKTKAIYKGTLNHGVYQLYCDVTTSTTFFTSSHFKLLKNNNTTEIGVGAVKSVTKVDTKYYSFAASNISGLFTINAKFKSDWDAVIEKYNLKSSKDQINYNLISNCNGKSTTFNAFNNTIYYATNNGLIALSKLLQKEIKYQNKTVYFTKLFYYNKTVYGFSSDEKMYFITSSNVIKRYKIPKIIEDEAIERIDLESKYLFIFTKNAIYQTNLDLQVTQKILTLTKDIEISDITVLNDEIYFASSKGVIVKKNKVIKNSRPPKLFIDRITANNKVRFFDKNTILPCDQNNIKIDFTILNYIPNEKCSVLYSVNNQNWNTLESTNRSLILSSLSSNEYTIRLKLNYKNSKELKTIHFTILKPFWQNPFLLFFGVLAVLALLYSYYKFQISKINKQNQLALEKINLEKNVNQSKLKAIKSQMNPHFFYNALNTIQSFILSNDKKQAVNYLSKFSALTRTILEMSEKETLSVTDEIKTLTLYLDIEKARFEDDFNYQIICDNNLDTDNCTLPSMLLQPSVENAVKHGLLHKTGYKLVTIEFKIQNEFLNISIDDNGIGRLKSAELKATKNKNHLSFATKATQHRVDLLNSYNNKNIVMYYIDKFDQENRSLGTTVVFEIPLESM